MSFCLVDQVCILACSVVPEAKAVHSAGDHVSTQDFAVTQKLFMVQRRLCKLSHEQCVADLVFFAGSWFHSPHGDGAGGPAHGA